MSYLNEKSNGSSSRKQRLTAVGTRCSDHVTPLYPQKLALTSPTGGGRSVGIVRVRTKATQFSLVLVVVVVAVMAVVPNTNTAPLRPATIHYNSLCKIPT